MHLRPADFFTSNPALDVPSTRNDASVLVPCCGQETGEAETTRADDNQDVKSGQYGKIRITSVQEEPFTHLQSGASDTDAKKAGANVEGSGEKEGLKRRLSKAAQRFLGGENKNDSQKS